MLANALRRMPCTMMIPAPPCSVGLEQRQGPPGSRLIVIVIFLGQKKSLEIQFRLATESTAQLKYNLRALRTVTMVKSYL